MGILTNADGQAIDAKPEPVFPSVDVAVRLWGPRPDAQAVRYALQVAAGTNFTVDANHIRAVANEAAHLAQEAQDARAELLQKDMVIAAQKEELAARMAEILQLREAVGVLREAAQEAQTLARQEVHAELMKLRMEVDDMKEELAGAGSDGRDLKLRARAYAVAMRLWARGTVDTATVGDARFDLLKAAEAYGAPVVEAVEEDAQDEHAHTY